MEKNLRSEKNIFSWLFWALGGLMLLSLLATILMERFILTSGPSTLYQNILYWGLPALLLLLFLCFWFKNKDQLKSSEHKNVWLLLCSACIAIPFIIKIILLCMGSINNPADFNIIEVQRGIQAGIIFSIFLLFGFQSKKRSYLWAAFIFMLAYLLSYLGSNSTILLREYVQAGGASASVGITLKEVLTSIVGIAAYLGLGVLSLSKSNGKEEKKV